MNPITTLVRSLGNDRALANARTALEDQAREDWIVQGLASRLPAPEPAEAAHPEPAAIPAPG
ncbi:MAG: hypothetical protein M3349_06230 [Actinomycetota bacterium]|nr:hypothetical protein [Actinomycetota bacterium]